MMNTQSEEPALTVAIVGAGPAGLYLSDALLLRAERPLRIDLYDRLPTPFGLLRYGVAPDHLKIKSFIRVLQRVLDDDRVRFFGNVTVGADISVDALRGAYDAVAYAAGASSDKRLGIDGEDLPGSVPAARFVKWYSGHPDVSPEAFDLAEVRDVAVVGAGNVALDVSRVLGRQARVLRETDIPLLVLERLARSAVRDIHVVARRGPQYTKFSTNELRELGDIDGLDVVVDPMDLPADPVCDHSGAPAGPVITRNLGILRDWSTRAPGAAPRRLHFHFGLAPTRLEGTESLEAVHFTGSGGSDAGATTSSPTVLPAQLIIRSVGYQVLPIHGVPFDVKRGTIPNDAGRVLRNSLTSEGEYAVGWISRGATGQLGTNRADADRVAGHLLSDAHLLLAKGSSRVPRDLVELAPHAYVDKRGWSSIDAAETALGQREGRNRAKIWSREDLLRHGTAR